MPGKPSERRNDQAAGPGEADGRRVSEGSIHVSDRGRATGHPGCFRDQHPRGVGSGELVLRAAPSRLRFDARLSDPQIGGFGLALPAD